MGMVLAKITRGVEMIMRAKLMEEKVLRIR
jgi:hypothetical protein